MIRMVIGRAVSIGPASMRVRITGGRTLTANKVLQNIDDATMLAVLMHPGSNNILDVMTMEEWNNRVSGQEEEHEPAETNHEEVPEHSLRVCSQTEGRMTTVGAIEDIWTDTSSGDGGFALNQSDEEARWD